MYASEAKKSEFLVHLDQFSKIFKYLFSKLGYSRIKIDYIADSLLKLQIKIEMHLINVELSQFLALGKISGEIPYLCIRIQIRLQICFGPIVFNK